MKGGSGLLTDIQIVNNVKDCCFVNLLIRTKVKCNAWKLGFNIF